MANGDCGSQGLPCLVLEQASAAVSLIYDHFFKPSNLKPKKERSWVNTYLSPMHFSVCKESRTVMEGGEDLWEGLPQSLDCSPISRQGLGLRLDRPQGSQPRSWVGPGRGWAWAGGGPGRGVGTHLQDGGDGCPPASAPSEDMHEVARWENDGSGF